MSWAEGCSCHVVVRQEGEGDDQEVMTLQRLLRSEISSPRHLPCRCPMMGCQAPFLASGHLSKLAENLSSAAQNFIAKCPERLSQQQWSDLLAEWQHGCSVVVENLKVRLSFYSTLPWVLLSGGHPDVSIAREGLKLAKQLWDDLPGNARSEQHVHVRTLFEDVTLSKELESFLESHNEFLEDFPSLEEFLAPFSFVQVAERIIEAAHKDLSQQRPKHFGMNLLSINMRLPELDRHLAGDASRFGSLVKAFHKVRRLTDFAENFPCHRNHPKLLALTNCKKGSPFERFVKEAFYRDASMQFADHRAAAAVNEQEAKRRGKVHQAFKPKTSYSHAALVSRAVHERIAATAANEPGVILSVRTGNNEETKFFTPVVMHPSLIHRPIHAPSTLQSYSPTDMIIAVLENRGVAKPVVPAMACGAVETLSLQALVEACGVDKFLKHLLSWSKGGALKYSLPMMRGHVSGLLQRMIEHGAVPSVGQALVIPEGSDELSAVPALESLQYIVKTRFR